MECISVVFSRESLFDEVAARVAAAVTLSAGTAEMLLMGREDYGRFVMLADMADARMRGALRHLHAESVHDGDCCDGGCCGVSGGVVVSGDAMVYRLELSHPLQRSMLPMAMERAFVLFVAQEWLRLRAVTVSLGVEEAWREMRAIALMSRVPPRAPYSYC
ncbi:MAG: hypothetical protein K2N21_05350 [Rikenellaceae bacterium]|nr:hypothetical protein [Rikenellaceae bacterium]